MLDFIAGTIVASSLMDRKGRKSLLITSFSGMVILAFNQGRVWDFGCHVRSLNNSLYFYLFLRRLLCCFLRCLLVGRYLHHTLEYLQYLGLSCKSFYFVGKIDSIFCFLISHLTLVYEFQTAMFYPFLLVLVLCLPFFYQRYFLLESEQKLFLCH